MATILVVEDSPDNMKLFRTLLTLRKHAVVGLTSGEGLLGTIEESLRVVALTAHAMAGDRERALAAGFDGYITKPIDIRSFPDQVARALEGERVTN
jgi:CheY-like chemotaxis protein